MHLGDKGARVLLLTLQYRVSRSTHTEYKIDFSYTELHGA